MLRSITSKLEDSLFANDVFYNVYFTFTHTHVDLSRSTCAKQKHPCPLSTIHADRPAQGDHPGILLRDQLMHQQLEITTDHQLASPIPWVHQQTHICSSSSTKKATCLQILHPCYVASRSAPPPPPCHKKKTKTGPCVWFVYLDLLFLFSKFLMRLIAQASVGI